MKILHIVLLFLLFLSSCKTGEKDDNQNNLNNSNNTNNINNNTNNTNNNLNNTNNANNANNTNNTSENFTIPVNTTWNWQLSSTPPDISDNFEMYDIDLFEITPIEIQAIQEVGALVICYFSAGSYEEWREDAANFNPDDIGNELDGWDGEYWLDISSESIKTVMEDRFDIAVEKGCDGIEPDNIDGYANNTGFDLTYEDQLLYNIWLADQAHARGLSIGLKNDGDQVIDLLEYFDWALSEECVFYDECELYRPFINSGKAVFHVEYVDEENQGTSLAQTVCNDPQRNSFSTLIKKWDLDYWFLSCN